MRLAIGALNDVLTYLLNFALCNSDAIERHFSATHFKSWKRVGDHLCQFELDLHCETTFSGMCLFFVTVSLKCWTMHRRQCSQQRFIVHSGQNARCVIFLNKGLRG